VRPSANASSVRLSSKNRRLLELGVFKKPTITLYTVADVRARLAKVAELVREPVKTIIFCDSIELGRRIAEAHGLPHVHGETRERLDKLRKAPQAVLTRVGDEGVSTAAFLHEAHEHVLSGHLTGCLSDNHSSGELSRVEQSLRGPENVDVRWQDHPLSES